MKYEYYIINTQTYCCAFTTNTPFDRKMYSTNYEYNILYIAITPVYIRADRWSECFSEKINMLRYILYIIICEYSQHEHCRGLPRFLFFQVKVHINTVGRSNWVFFLFATLRSHTWYNNTSWINGVFSISSPLGFEKQELVISFQKHIIALIKPYVSQQIQVIIVWSTNQWRYRQEIDQNT